MSIKENNQKNTKAKITQPKKKAIIIATIVLIGVGTVGVAWFANRTSESSDRGDTSVIQPGDGSGPRGLNPVEKATQLSEGGDYEGGQKLIDEELMSAASNDNEKRDGFIQKSLFALNNSHHDEATGYAKEADAIKSDRLTLRLLGQIAEDKGDNAEAARYYQAVVSSYEGADLDDGDILQRNDDKEALGRVQ